MLAYQCDEEGYFAGMYPRQESPAEPGVWLMPRNATDIKPPECAKDQRARFDHESNQWSIVDFSDPKAPKVVEAQGAPKEEPAKKPKPKRKR